MIDDLDGQEDTDQGYKSLLSGPRPDVHRFTSRSDEQDFLKNRVKGLSEQRRLEDICLVARTSKMLRDDYEPLIRSLGLDHTLLEKKRERTRHSPGNHAPGQGTGIPGDDLGWNQFASDASSALGSGRRPHSQGRT